MKRNACRFLLMFFLTVFAVPVAWGAEPVPPYPMVQTTDIFGVGEALSSKPESAWRSDHFSVGTDAKSWTVGFDVLSADVSQLSLLLLRTISPRGNWKIAVTHTGAILSSRDMLEVAISGDMIPFQSVELRSGDVTKDLTFSWDFKGEKVGISQATLQSTRYTLSGDEKISGDTMPMKFSVALVSDPDTFVLGYAAGADSPPPSAFRYITLPHNTDKPVAMTVFATTTDKLWLRVLNMGKHGIRVSGPGFSGKGTTFAGGTLPGATLFPSYMTMLQSNLITGMTFDLTIEGIGGYDMVRKYPCSVNVVPYYLISVDAGDPLNSTIAGVTIQPVQMEMPDGMSSVQLSKIGTNNQFGEADSAAYAALIPQGFEACYFDIGAQRFDPETTIGLPVLVNWKITSQDLHTKAGLSWEEVREFFNTLKAPVNVTQNVFTHLRVWKQFGSLSASDLIQKTGNNWPFFFETGYDNESESIALRFRTVVVDSEKRALTLAKIKDIGFFPIFDGNLNGIFRDPLCLSFSKVDLSVPAGAESLGPLPNPIPGGSDPTTTPPPNPSGQPGKPKGSGSKGGCSLGTAPLWAFFLAPLMLLFNQRKR